MRDLISKFKIHTIEMASEKNFIHHKWFVKRHLNIIEKIVLELLELYPGADANIVETMIWFHDYGKIIDFDNQYDIKYGKQALKNIGFPDDFIDKICEYSEIMDSKINIENAPIEVKIISSADGAAHLVGPFFMLHWYENPDKTVDDLLASNLNKAKSDWDKKIVLPEIKERFLERHKMLLEHAGELPKHFLK